MPSTIAVPPMSRCFMRPTCFSGYKPSVGLASILNRGSFASFATKTAPAKASQGPTAVVMLNMGGPATLDEVGPFLTRLFTDQDIMNLGRFQHYIGRMISYRRTPKIQAQYAEIGGGSPIREWSELQCSEMCRILDETSPLTAPHKPYVAFRYASPLTEETYKKLLDDGFGGGRAGRAVAFSQYPQYSCTTTGSSLNELFKWRKKLEGNGENQAGTVQWSVIDRWPTHPGLVEAIAQNIEKSLLTYPEERRNDAVILFSAHSLPMSVVNKGDTYPAEVAATVWAVMTRLGFKNPYRLCWQSSVGPRAWLGAQTQQTVENYLKAGRKDLLLVPVAFTSDHIETLYELDKEIIEEMEEPGLKRSESLNGSPTFIKGLADLVKEHLESGQQCSRQFLLPCQGGVSERSLEQKSFFAREAITFELSCN